MRYHLIILLLSVSTSLLQAQDPVRQVADSLITAGHYPGLYFSIYEDSTGQAINYTAGFADVEQQIPMNPGHRMLSGSTGKTFVSAVLMQLMQEGKLTPDDRISEFLGNETWFDRLPNGRELTVRHLMQHQSGLARYVFKPEFAEQVRTRPDRVWEPHELVAYILDDSARFAPGEGFAYSDTNYILLGMIIEQVTGKPFYEVLSGRILQPLVLTAILPTDTRRIADLAQGYVGENDPLGFTDPVLENGLSRYNLQFEWTGGGLAFRTSDYARWLSYLFTGKAFNMEDMSDTFYQTVEAREVGGRYGMGFMVLELPQLGEVYGHAGFFPGYYTLGIYDPDTGTAYAMQVNTTDQAKVRLFFRDFLALIRAGM